MAKNADISRLRRKKKRLRAKYKKQQRVIRGLDKANARWIHDARQEGVARLRAEDQLDDERSEYRAYREQTHQHMLALTGAARPDRQTESSPADMEAKRDLAVEAARISAEAEVLEALLRKQRAADALSDYLASRPKRARVEEIEDAAAPEPKRVRASD